MSKGADRVVITGGEGDLALEIKAHLSEQGYVVEAPGRRELDVTDDHAIRHYFKNRQTDLLICNAAITHDRPLALLTENDWNGVWDVNFTGALHCARAVIESMKGRGGGSVIFISSYSALRPPVGQTAYATSKAALLGIMRDLARQHGDDNIRINAILPGFLDTKMTKSVSSQRCSEVISEHVLKRFNTPGQVAAFVRFLHQDLPHSSGQVFQLDSRIAD